MNNTCYLFDIDLIERSTRPSFPKLPNHALLKFTDYYKKKGYTVKLIYLPKDIPLMYNKNNIYIGSALYTPNLNRFKKRLQLIKQKINKNNILEIDHINIGTPTDYCPITDYDGIKCDYSLYDNMIKEDNIHLDWYPRNIGFLTRHCIRGCSFCVNRDRRAIKEVNTIEDIYQLEGQKIELLDDNLFAYHDAGRLLRSIGEFYDKHHITVRLQNGLDCREITEDKLKGLKIASKAFEEIYCAWDDVRNTFIYKNINIIKNTIPTELRTYILIGNNVKTREDFKKDLLSFYYRYLMLDYIGVKAMIQVFEDDLQKYSNPYLKHYKLLKNQYSLMKNGATVGLFRTISGDHLEVANEIKDTLDEFSYLTNKLKYHKYNPLFNSNMEQVADYLGIKHYKPVLKNKKK